MVVVVVVVVVVFVCLCVVCVCLCVVCGVCLGDPSPTTFPSSPRPPLPLSPISRKLKHKS